MLAPQPAPPGVGAWQSATVVDIRPETERIKTFRLALSEPTPHLAGQHYLVRLTAPDGYRAQRSYSIATPPTDDEIELTVERLPDGEVSTFLHDEVVVGDILEVRGPIGGWFVWDGTTPAVLLGGGSGVVPLMAMLRLARRTPAQPLAHLIVSVRSPRELLYADEMTGPDVTVIYSRSAPGGSERGAGRITSDDLINVLHDDQTAYVCGPDGYAETASALLMENGTLAENIRVERFGPSG
jgi:ferredoxin-NADP reductase